MMFTEFSAAYRNAIESPRSFVDLTQAINTFAAKHKANPEVFFEVLFNHLDDRIQQLHKKENAFEIRCLSSIANSPLLIAIDSADSNNPKPDPNNCLVVFKDNRRVSSMLTVFAIDNMFPGYEYKEVNRWGENPNGKFEWGYRELFPVKNRGRWADDDDGDEFIRRIEEGEQDLERLANISVATSPAEFHLQLQGFALKDLNSCAIPNKFFINFLNSPAAEAAMQRIKDNPELWSLYDATISTPQAMLNSVGLTDRVCLNTVVIFKDMLDKINQAAAPYKIDCFGTGVFEQALSHIYKANETPKESRKPLPGLETYAAYKLSCRVQIKISVKAIEQLVANINSHSAQAEYIYPHGINLPYKFILQDFLPKFANLLATNSEFVAAMQVKSTSLKKERKVSSCLKM